MDLRWRYLDEDTQNALESLNQIVQSLLTSTWSRLNRDFAVIPNLHPFAQCAICHTHSQWEQLRTWHIYTDGAARKKQAACEFVIIGECSMAGQTSFCRYGYAGGLLNDHLQSCELNALNAEATALIAMSEFLLTQTRWRNMPVHCHFDTLSVGQGAFGFSKTCQFEGQDHPLQQAARMMVSLVQSAFRTPYPRSCWKSME